MISKAEAITRLKKMGVTVADDQSIVTILLPKGMSLAAAVKDIKEKMKSIDYDASFCIKQKKDLVTGSGMDLEEEPQDEDKETDVIEASETVDKDLAKKDVTEQEEELLPEVTEEDLQGSLLSMDDDGQFTLGGFGMDF